ncbi:MAG: hypothetical protein SVG88_13610 [Halobacteriales archaeon]|nr:hypothetical protein [Halobacteriales archaeon]
MTSLETPPYTNHNAPQLSTRWDDYPDFALEVLFDDHESPQEVTIFSPEEAEITTHWITASVEDAVPLEEVA